MYRIAVILTLGFCLAFTSLAAASDAPDFELKDTKGKKHSSEDLRSDCKLLLIDFWQVGCKPCNELMPHLQEYYDTYKEDGLEVVIISMDTSLTEAQVAPFFKSNDYTFLVLRDPSHEVSKDYGVKAPPASFLITSDGELIYQHFTYKKGQEKEIEAKIKDYLAGKKVKSVDLGE
jgi:peroxiredoxin